MEHSLYCPDCDTTGPHDLEGREVACRWCGSVREADPELLAAVLDMAFCATCREHRPAGHSCYPDAMACLSRTQLHRCGACGPCVALQQTDPRYGSPSDLDHPA